MNNSNPVKQLYRFIVTGSLAVIMDSSSYYLLKSEFDPSISKAISFLLGTCIAYLLNKFWTFQKKKYSTKELIKFIILYSCTLGANVVTNYSILMLYRDLYLFAFLGATGVSTVLNFVGQKWWVFPSDADVNRSAVLQRGEKYPPHSREVQPIDNKPN